MATFDYRTMTSPVEQNWRMPSYRQMQTNTTYGTERSAPTGITAPPPITFGDTSGTGPGGSQTYGDLGFYDNFGSTYNPYTNWGGYGGGFGGSSGGEGGEEGDGGGFWGNLGNNIPGIVAGGLTAGGLYGMFGGNNSPGQRNLPAELTGILNLVPQAAGNNAAIQGQLSPYFTGMNISNFNTGLSNAPNLRAAYDAANQGQAAFTAGLPAYMNQLNQQGGFNAMPATGYAAYEGPNVNAGPASQAAFNPAAYTSGGAAAQAQWTPSQAYTANASQAAQQLANATTAQQQTAAGGPLLNPLERDAAMNLGQLSPLQMQQQQIAQQLLNQGGNITEEEKRNVIQDTRAGYAARGLGLGNESIAAEALNTDAAKRARLLQNVSAAQGIDTAGQAQLQAGRGYALGVQGQGQGLSQFNAGQGNQMGQFNAGLLTNTSQFNAGQGNMLNQFNSGQLNDISRFNAGLLTQNNQFNSGLGAQMSQYNAGAQDRMSQFNSGQANDMSRYNAGLGASMGTFNAGAQNQMNQYNAGLAQQSGLATQQAHNQAQQYNVDQINAMNRFNAGMGQQSTNDQWARAMQLGNLYQGQAINPSTTAMGLMGNSPDYTMGLLGYGQDLNNTNYNANASAIAARQNNSAALTAAGLNALYSIYGRG